MPLTLHLGLRVLIWAEITLGVAPFDVLGLEPEQGARLRQLAAEHLAEHDHQLVEDDAVDAAVGALELEGDELRSCLREGPCAARVARHAGVDQLVVGSVAGLGQTFVLHLALVDAQREVVTDEVQQSVEGQPEVLSVALEEQLDRLLPPPRPWYRRWWFWTAVGAVVAAAAVTTLVLLWPEQDDIDTYPLP